MKMTLLSVLFLSLVTTTQASENILITPLSSVDSLTHSLSVETQSRASYDFGFVWVNSINRASFRITNTSDIQLNYKSVQIFGSQYTAWHKCKNGLAPNQSCVVTIELWPFSEGSQNGQFRLNFVEDSSIIDLWGYARR